jgi:hypothetical protein
MNKQVFSLSHDTLKVNLYRVNTDSDGCSALPCTDEFSSTVNIRVDGDGCSKFLPVVFQPRLRKQMLANTPTTACS